MGKVLDLFGLFCHRLSVRKSDSSLIIASLADTEMLKRPGYDLMEITLNGETRRLEPPLSVRGLLDSLGLDPAKIAVERNLEIVPRSTYDAGGAGRGRPAGDRAFHRRRQCAGGCRRAEDKPLRDGGQDLQVAPDHRHRQVQDLCRQCRGAGGERRGDRHRGGAAGEPHRSQPAQAGGFHRSEESTPICPTPPAASPARTRCAPCAWRARPAAGRWSSWKCWARRSCSIPT